MDHPYAALPRDVDDPLEEGQIHALPGGIGREAQDQHLRPRPGVADRLLERLEEVDTGDQPHVTDVGAGDDHAIGVDRVGRIGHQHRVAGTDRGEREMREPLLGADGDDRLGVRVE